jgi:ATP-binding cassette subfamily F protein 3
MRVANVLKGLGFTEEDYDQPCNSFSGGWQMRIALARLLLSEPEVLILDEPTNHLDAAARKWLGEYVGKYEGTVLLVSHDVEMLRRAVDSIAEVRGGSIETYKTMGYDKFLVEREERAARALAEYAAQERELKKMQEFVDRMGAKASKATQAQDRMKKIAKLEESMKLPAFVESERAKGRRVKLTLAKPPSVGQWPVSLKDAAFGYAPPPEAVEEAAEATSSGGAPILSKAELKVERGMRLVVRGPNGAGKSTLLKALSGDLPLIEGERVEDERLSLGLFAQDLAQELPQDVRGVDYVCGEVREHDPLITDVTARTIMGSLGLHGEKATRRIGDLSGGEKARVALATFCLTPHNVLLLDEPTNHLDVEAIDSLLDALARYEGAIVVVSHDRPFCEAIEATHVAYVANGAIDVEERSLRESDWNEEVGRSVARD